MLACRSYTPPGELSRAVDRAVAEVARPAARTSTSGGTSDGRFIAPPGAQVVEFGVINRTIHKVNELRVADIDRLHRVFGGIAQPVFLSSHQSPTRRAAPARTNTQDGIDRPRNVQSIFAHSPPALNTFRITSVSGMISSM